MAIVTSTCWVYPKVDLLDNFHTMTGYTIDASGEQLGIIFQAPATGSITGASFKTVAVTASDTLDVRLETVSSGEPSGTLATTGSNASQGSLADNTYYQVTFGTAHSATKGDWLALVVAHGGSANLQIAGTQAGIGTSVFAAENPCLMHKTAGSWARVNDRAMVGAINYGGTYYCIRQIVPHETRSGNMVDNTSVGTTGQLIGARFRVPFPMRILGIMSFTLYDDVALTCKLFDSDASTVLASATIPSQAIDGYSNTAGGIFATSQTLTKDTWYRAVFEKGTGNANMYHWPCVSQAETDGIFSDFHLTKTSSGSAPTQESDWTNTDTDIPGIGLLVDGFDDGTGGGSSPALFRQSSALLKM